MHGSQKRIGTAMLGRIYGSITQILRKPQAVRPQHGSVPRTKRQTATAACTTAASGQGSSRWSVCRRRGAAGPVVATSPSCSGDRSGCPSSSAGATRAPRLRKRALIAPPMHLRARRCFSDGGEIVFGAGGDAQQLTGDRHGGDAQCCSKLGISMLQQARHPCALGWLSSSPAVARTVQRNQPRCCKLLVAHRQAGSGSMQSGAYVNTRAEAGNSSAQMEWQSGQQAGLVGQGRLRIAVLLYESGHQLRAGRVRSAELCGAAGHRDYTVDENKGGMGDRKKNMFSSGRSSLAGPCAT